jgi:hypothetical protein
MPIPNLIHPLSIQIQKQDTDETDYDDDFREPVQQTKRASTVTVDGQVKWGSHKSYSSNRRGPQESSDGYILFRYVDLNDAGITLEREDKIIKIGNLDVNVYINSLLPEGHYPDQGGYTLVKAFFVDRQPARIE